MAKSITETRFDELLLTTISKEELEDVIEDFLLKKLEKVPGLFGVDVNIHNLCYDANEYDTGVEVDVLGLSYLVKNKNSKKTKKHKVYIA